MKTVSIYHNPRCSKSRQALELLKNKNLDLKIIEYLKDVPSEAELKEIIKKLDIEPDELLRKKEEIYKELVSLHGEPDSKTAINWMLKHPKLIERPIVISSKGARIGRPVECILEIL